MISYIRHLYYKADILQLAMDSTPRRSPRYPAELSQFPDALLHEVFRKLFRSHVTGGSVRRNSFINLA